MGDSEPKYFEEYDIVNLIRSITSNPDTNSNNFRSGSTENGDRVANPVTNPNQSHLVFTGISSHLAINGKCSNYVEVKPSYSSPITLLTMDNCCVPAPAVKTAQVEADTNKPETTDGDGDAAATHAEAVDVVRDPVLQISAPNIIVPESLTSSISIVVCQLCRKKFVNLGFLVTHMEVAHQVVIHNKKEDLSLQIPGAGEPLPVKRESGVGNSNIADAKAGRSLNVGSDPVPLPVPDPSNLSHRVSPWILSKKSSADRDRVKVLPLLFPHPSPAPIHVHVYPPVPTFELTTRYLDQAIDVDASPRRKQKMLGRVKTTSSNTSSSSNSVSVEKTFGPGSGDFAKPRDPKQRRCSSGVKETVIERGIKNEVGFRFRCDICFCPLSTQDALDRHKFRCEFMHSESDVGNTMTN